MPDAHCAPDQIVSFDSAPGAGQLADLELT